MRVTPYQVAVAFIRDNGSSTLEEVANELIAVFGWYSVRRARYEARDTLAYGIRDGALEVDDAGAYDCVYPRAMEIGLSWTRVTV